jgi:hypothetical protein
MSLPLEIVRVEPGSREQTAFIQLPRRLYAGVEQFVPWFDRQLESLIKRQHPFFEHSDGEFFVAIQSGTCVGRIALLEPVRYNELNDERTARFYFFDSENETAISDALFAFARKWAADRGLERLVGPQGFTSFSGAGILIHGYDRQASMNMMPYHFPYYRELVEAAGFEPLQDFHSPYLDASRHDLAPRYIRAAEIARKRGRFTSPPIRSRRELRTVAEEIRDAYNDAWQTRENYTPLTQSELDHIVEDLLLVSKPSLIRVLRSRGELAGFILAFPDLSTAMRKAAGKLNLLTYGRLMWEKQRSRRFIINGFGLRPDFRKSGGTALLFYEITKALKEHGVLGAEMTQIAADNDLMMSNVYKLNADIVKTHRVYQRTV